ncbi:MAG: MFS transporter [Mycobacteriales bacterium]|nr:MFS transporter [Mycobacteriales bacterium]
MATYREVLRHREMPAVMTAHAISLTGSVAAEVALSVLVYSRTSSPFLASLTLACAFVPQAFSAFVLSGVVDRVPPRRLLVGIDLLCALLVACMAVREAPIWVLLLLAACVGVVTPLFSGARAATLADVLEGETWVRARSLMRVISQSSLLMGFAVGGIALTVVTPRTLLVVDAVSFALSAALLRLGTSERPARAAGGPRPSRAAIAALRHPRIRPVLLLTWLPAACVCSIDALATPYAAPSTIGIGALLVAAAAGSVLAEVLGRRVTRVAPVAALTGVGLLLFAFHPPVWLAVPVVVLAMQGGAIGQWLDARLLEELPLDLRGQLLALQQGLLMGIQGAGVALSGALAEVFPPYAVLAGAGVVALVTVAVLLPQVQHRAPTALTPVGAGERATGIEPA